MLFEWDGRPQALPGLDLQLARVGLVVLEEADALDRRRLRDDAIRVRHFARGHRVDQDPSAHATSASKSFGYTSSAIACTCSTVLLTISGNWMTGCSGIPCMTRCASAIGMND